MQVQDSRPAAAVEPQQAVEEESIESVDVFDLTQIDKVRRVRPGRVFL
jgi:hypothetical protein